MIIKGHWAHWPIPLVLRPQQVCQLLASRARGNQRCHSAPPSLMRVALPTRKARWANCVYPIVLVHGLLGFTRRSVWITLRHLHRFLNRDGARVSSPRCRLPTAMRVRGSSRRSAKNILAVTGAGKVNLIWFTLRRPPTTRYVVGVVAAAWPRSCRSAV
jgi:hypothetical protein